MEIEGHMGKLPATLSRWCNEPVKLHVEVLLDRFAIGHLYPHAAGHRPRVLFRDLCFPGQAQEVDTALLNLNSILSVLPRHVVPGCVGRK